MYIVIAFLVAYFVSAISPSIIISKKVLGNDIRTLGSKNAGTTNAIRTMGKKWGVVVFILDILKVLLAYGIVIVLAKLAKENISQVCNSVFVVACILGHTYPIYYGFRGGKGVAVYLAAMLIIDVRLALVCMVVAIILIAIFRYVSLASICGCVLAVIIAMFMKTNLNPWVLILASGIVIFNHRKNIARLVEGTEGKLFVKKEKENTK